MVFSVVQFRPNGGKDMKLRVVIERDEMGYYVAEVPALPGCVSQGRTLAEARENIKEAIMGWLSVMNAKAKRHKSKTVEVLI